MALTRLREAADEGAFDLGLLQTRRTTAGDVGGVPHRHQRARPADAAGRRVLRLGSGGGRRADRRLSITELEFFYSARSAKDREETIRDLREAFGWVPVHDRAYARAWEVQGELTARGQHRAAGPVDLVVAATAELFGLTLLHHDRDFATIAGVTGQYLRLVRSRLRDRRVVTGR